MPVLMLRLHSCVRPPMLCLPARMSSIPEPIVPLLNIIHALPPATLVSVLVAAFFRTVPTARALHRSLHEWHTKASQLNIRHTIYVRAASACKFTRQHAPLQRIAHAVTHAQRGITSHNVQHTALLYGEGEGDYANQNLASTHTLSTVTEGSPSPRDETCTELCMQDPPVPRSE